MDSLQQFQAHLMQNLDATTTNLEHASVSPNNSTNSNDAESIDHPQPPPHQDIPPDTRISSEDPKSYFGDTFGSMMKSMFAPNHDGLDPDIHHLTGKTFPISSDSTYPKSPFRPSHQHNITESPTFPNQKSTHQTPNPSNMPNIFVYKHPLLSHGTITMDMAQFIHISKSLPGGQHLITHSIEEAQAFAMSNIHPPHSPYKPQSPSPSSVPKNIPMGPSPTLYPPTQPFSHSRTHFPHQSSSIFPPNTPPFSYHNPTSVPSVPYPMGHSSSIPGPPVHPTFSQAYFPSSIPHGFEHMFLKRKAFICPEWDGDPYSWFETKTKITTSLHECNLHHLLTASQTNPSNAEGSKIFAVGMLKKFKKDALAYFSGPHSESWHSHGVEMWKYLLARYEPTSPAALLSLTKEYSALKQEDNESFTSFLRRLNYLVLRLAQCNDVKDPTIVVSKAIDSMHNIYDPIYQSIACGQANPVMTLQDLESLIHNFDRLSGRQPGAPPKPKTARAAKVSDDITKTPKPQGPKDMNPQIMVGTENWNTECTNALLSKQYGCILCRMKNHNTWDCNRVRSLFSKNGYEIRKLQPSPTLATPQPAPAPSSILTKTATFAQLPPTTDKVSAVTSNLPQPPADASENVDVPDVSQSLGSRLISNKNNSHYIVGHIKNVSFISDSHMDNECIIDSGATSTMWPYIEDFSKYNPMSNHFVTLADDSQIRCHGIGEIRVRFKNKTISITQVLHVPELRCPLYSIRRHRRQEGCEFLALNEGIFLIFPHFILDVDDSNDCLIQWSRILILLPPR